MEPIGQLMHKDVPLIWSQAQDTAFAEMKQIVTKAEVLVYYDLKVAFTKQCNANSAGLGTALLQGKPEAYANRALTDTKQRNPHIEKEMLVIVISQEKFGRRTEIHTDHKPLEAIVKKKTLQKR